MEEEDVPNGIINALMIELSIGFVILTIWEVWSWTLLS